MIDSQWPPVYTLRVNRRAKNINLKVCPQKGLQITIPHPAEEQHALDFLETNRHWVEKQLSKIELINKDHELPQTIAINALEQTWTVEYVPKFKAKTIRLMRNHAELLLVLHGNIQDEELCRQKLNAWIREYAKLELPIWLEEISSKINLSFNKVTIRSQETMWGSCTHDKGISLNDRLLFLPSRWAEYILVHELCHTVYLDHSRAFWNLVSKYIPEQQKIRKQMRNAQQYLPGWLN